VAKLTQVSISIHMIELLCPQW